ncbi:MAG: flagellar hook-length control protein FliK [Myxococcaceae bacterium]
MASETEQNPGNLARAAKTAGPELRLLDRRAFIGFPALELGAGLRIDDFALQIPDVSFPFNLSGGPSRYQRKRLLFGYLEVSLSAERVHRHIADVAERLADFEGLRLHFRPGYLEGQAQLRSGERAPLTFKVAFDGEGERLAVYVYDVRLYAASPVPSAQVPLLLSRALEPLGVLPDFAVRGATGFSTRVLPALVQAAAVARGFKVPLLDGARLASAEVSGQGLKLRFASGGLPPPSPPDEELLLTLEGARAFADAEALLAQGRWVQARDAYLRLGDITDAHPFAAERLLSLLVADPQAQDLALDVAASIAHRRERSPAALWGEAVVRERRGEGARAAERFLALCAMSRKRQEDAAAFFAAEAAARAARDQAPQMAVRALHELLGLRPDHLPSLQALARASDQAKDRAGAMRAYRRIAALARDPAESAEAHVALARLASIAENDVAGARLHCEAALRLSTDHPEALFLLGDLSHRAGEHLRALKAADRLRDVAIGRHELDRVGRAHLLAGRIWENGLEQLENALLRYREAVSHLPHEPEPLAAAARVAEKLGKLQEAVAGYQQAVELAGPAPASEDIRLAAHSSHHALARLYRTRLGDPILAREHLESALALDPKDAIALEALIPAFRAAGRSAELADALEKAAALAEEPGKRAAYWAEAGELYRAKLGQVEKAERLLLATLEIDSRHPQALTSLLALAEGRRDGPLLCRCLKGLAELSVEPKERARYLRRLGLAARDVALDVDLAAWALSELLRFEPDDLTSLTELCALQRKRGDLAALAAALEMRAKAAESARDVRLASTTLRELAQILETRLGRMGEALVCLEKAARLSPDVATLTELADISLRMDRPDHARRAFEDVLMQLPRHVAPERLAELKAKLGQACERLGDEAAARRYYAEAFPVRRLDDALAERLEALYVRAGAHAELSEFWASRGEALVSAGRGEAAAALLLKGAGALLDLGRREAAVVKLAAVLEAAPEGDVADQALALLSRASVDPGTQLEVARLYARKAAQIPDGERAAQLFWRAAELAQNSPREDEYLAEVLVKNAAHVPARIRRAQKWQETAPEQALDELERALGVPSDAPLAPSPAQRASLLRQAADAAQKAGHPDRARAHLARYVAERPEDLAAQLELLTLLRSVGEDEARCDLLAELWPRLDGEARWNACREFSELALRQGRGTEALEAFRALHRQSPDDSGVARSLLSLMVDEPQGAQEAEERLTLLSQVLGDLEGSERATRLSERANLHLILGAPELARRDLAEAAQLAPQAAPVWVRVAELAREGRDAKDETQAWAKAFAASPDAATAERKLRVFELSRQHLERDEAELALLGFGALTILPLEGHERHEALLGTARAHKFLGRFADAALALGEAAKHGPGTQRLAALLEQAVLYEQQGEGENAARAYEAALALSPHHATAAAGLIRLLRDAKDWTGLAELLESRARAVSPEEAANIYEELGQLYLDALHQPGPAEAALRRAWQRTKRPDLARRLAILAAERGDLTEALARGREAAATMTPVDASSTLLRLGQHADELGAHEEALALWREAHRYQPLTGMALADFAERLFISGSVNEALPLLESAAQLRFDDFPERRQAILLNLADAASALGRQPLAEQVLTDLVREFPFLETAVERLGELWWASKPREAAQLFLTFAEQLRSTHHAAQLLIGAAQRAQERLADVELVGALLDRALLLAPDPLPVHELRANLWRESGRTPQLLEELRLLALAREERGEWDGAIEALGEQARLAEESGRIDEALTTLERLAQRAETHGSREAAALAERHRAELLRDGRGEADAALGALERSFALFPEVRTAQLGVALAAQRKNVAGQVQWLSRAAQLTQAPAARAALLMEVAAAERSMAGREQEAETAAREALALVPGLLSAEKFLADLYEESGRLTELAAFYEAQAASSVDRSRRVVLLENAAALYEKRLSRPAEAAAALLAAHGADPDNLALTSRVAEALHRAGRSSDALEFDSLLVDADPFHPSVERVLAYFREAERHQDLAELLLRRAARQEGREAAQSYLDAADAFQKSEAAQRAGLCVERAFDTDPTFTPAFERLRDATAADVRRLADVLARRSVAVPDEAERYLGERAQRLLDAGEALLGAAALDDLLAVAPQDVAALLRRGDLANEAGGPAAAQPYDRRVLALSGEAFPKVAAARLWLRLGHAALAQGALRDAQDAFEAALGSDPSGDLGREARSLLAEVYARTDNTEGLYRTSLELAQTASPAEKEALLRRAASLFDTPETAVDAWYPLAQMRPMDVEVVERAAQGLRAKGRLEELAALYEISAEALGGEAGAKYWGAAAQLWEEPLHDTARAQALWVRAASIDSTRPEALRALADDAAKRGNAQGRLDALLRLAELPQESTVVAGVQLELAEVARDLGQLALARKTLEALASGGASSPGYADALSRLEPLISETDEPGVLAGLWERRAELSQGAARAALLLRAGRVHAQRDDPTNALRDVLGAANADPTAIAFEQLARLYAKSNEHVNEAEAWGRAALLSGPEARGDFLLRAADAHAAAGQQAEARERLDQAAQALGDRLPPWELSARLAALGAHAEAFTHGFELALSRGELERAEELARNAANESALLRVADTHFQANRFDDAIRMWDSLAFDASQEATRAAAFEQLLTLFAKTPGEVDAWVARALETFAQTPETLERLLHRYVGSGLHPFAVAVAQRLMSGPGLTPAAARQAAEGLVGTPQGAPLAAHLWRDILRSQPADADGWTLYALALRQLDQGAAAERADGFGAALTESQKAAPWVPMTPVSLGAMEGLPALPTDATPVDAANFPRLAHVLHEAFVALGVGDWPVVLDARGGVEAYVAWGPTWVLGTSALSRFGPAELAYLAALTFALGGRSAQLRGHAPLAGFDEAAVQALRAVPSTLAACRVVAALHPQARGADPALPASRLPLAENSAFAALARDMLSWE